MQRKLPRQSEGKRKNDYLENGDSVHSCTRLKQYGDVNQPYGASSSGITSHSSFLPTLSGTRSEIDGLPSPSFKESSYASNMENSQAAAIERNEKRARLCHQHDVQPLSRSLKNERMANPMPLHYPGSAQQQAHQFENENEDHSEVVGVSIGFCQEQDSSNVQESSSMGSALDEISLEATGFRQLQHVMDQVLRSFKTFQVLSCVVSLLVMFPLDYKVEVNIPSKAKLLAVLPLIIRFP